MAKASMSLEKWRDYFSSANSDIFDVIKHAIIVAASDCPREFKLQRDGITELLFTCKLAKCCGCGGIRLDDCVEKIGGKYCKCVMESDGSNGNRNVDRISDHDAEALSDEIEEETRMIDEVSRIKQILNNHREESDASLFELLTRLQEMHLSLEILTGTSIGKSVYALRKHGSKEIRSLARALIEEWKSLADAWVSSTAAIAGPGATKESTKTSVTEEEEGLPSPPMDEGALLATPASMELSKIFDGMDDDGNLQIDLSLHPRKNQELTLKKVANRPPNGLSAQSKKSGLKETTIPKWHSECSIDSTTPIQTLKKEFIFSKPNRPFIGVNGPSRSMTSNPVVPKPKPVAQPKINAEIKVLPELQEKLISHPNESDCDGETSFGMKLEMAKRKLHERYQEAEKAKKQRTIQVMEVRDLPKQAIHRGIRAGGPATTMSNRR